jgi:ATP-dependent Clp protease adapter protein ClpS
MPNDSIVADPLHEEWTLPQLDERDLNSHDGPHVVILYNDDYHDVMDVTSQIQKATGYQIERCFEIMLEAHYRGRAITYTGSAEECERAANVLRQIRLQVETDQF